MNQNEIDLFASLEEGFMRVEVEDKVEPVTEMSDEALVMEASEVQIALRDLQQRIRPHTQEARDFHSRNNALQLELHKRGLK